MPKLPEHLKVMLERCADDEHLCLTASCGCEVKTVIHDGEKIPYVIACKDHIDDMLAATGPAYDTNMPAATMKN